MRSLVLRMCAALLFVTSAVAQRPPGRDHANLGISLARERRLPEAERELREAVRVAPAVASYRAQLASILGLQGKWKESLTHFRKAIDLSPEDLDFRRETAAVEWQLGLMPAAEKNLRFVLARQPADVGAILLLGLVKERTGDYNTAAQLLESQFELVISQPDRTVALFHSFSASGQHDKASKIVDVLKLRAHDPGWTKAISQCAQIAASNGNLATSQALFALIPGNDSGRAAAGVSLAKLLYRRGQVPQAKQLLLQMAEHGVVSVDLQVLLANCFQSEHQPFLAIKAYQRAIELEPKRIDYYGELVLLLLDLGKMDDARALVNRALAMAPNDAKPWLWKGHVNFRSHAYKDAIESYTHAGSLDRSNADAVLGIAAVHFIAGQTEAAIADYKAGIVRFPNEPRLHLAYAQTLLASPDAFEQQATAKDLLQRAVKLAPQLAEAHYQLGQLAMRQNRLSDAEGELLLSLQSAPDQSKAHFALATVYRRMGRTENATKQFAMYQELKQAEESGRQSAMIPAEKQ